MKSYLYILGLLAVVIVAGCTYAAQETGKSAEAVNEIVAEESAAGVSEALNEVKEFTMTARQWEFDPEVVRVNKGDTVRLFIQSIDVTHGFALPDFGVNERLSPGQTVEIEFVADKAGKFTFFCSVQCGAGHSSMNGQLIVE